MAIKKSDLYSSLWASCDELRGGMDASQLGEGQAMVDRRDKTRALKQGTMQELLTRENTVGMKESQHVEWKESWRDEYLRWVCGFANADGGMLVIGRNDEGRVVGLADAARLLEELPNKIRDLLGIIVDVNLRSEGGRIISRVGDAGLSVAHQLPRSLLPAQR